MSYLRNVVVIVSAAFCLTLASCDQDDIEVASIVEFEETSVEVNDQTTFPIPISLTITPDAIVESDIVVSIKAGSGTTITTTPQENNRIPIAVEAGETTTSFEINTLTTSGEDSEFIEFEIIDVGPGLLTNDLDGRFLTLDVQPPEESFLFRDDFSNCSGQNLPLGWSQEVVMQNQEGSAMWNCTPVPSVEINAFVGGSSDQTMSEVWLISPAIDLTSVNTAHLQFGADRRFEVASPGLVPYDVQIATDFTAQGFENANWQPFNAGIEFIESDDPAADGFSQSEKISLSAFGGEIIHVAFIYRAGAAGTNDATILRIRDFEVLEN